MSLTNKALLEVLRATGKWVKDMNAEGNTGGS